MGLLDKLLGKRRDVPAWADFFDSPGYRAFITLLEEDLRGRGLRYQLGEGFVSVVLQPGEDPQNYGLTNLAQACNLAPREEWAAIIARHFRIMLQSVDGGMLDRLGESFELARAMLKVRIYPDDYLAEGGAKLCWRRLAAGLIQVLVYDLPDTVATIRPEDAQKWPLDEDGLFAVALENVAGEGAVSVREVELGDGASIHAIVGDTFFVASHALLLERHLDLPREGAIIAIPHRHAVLVHPFRDARVLAAINSMIPIAAGMCHEGPGSISPDLYWLRRDGSWLHLPVEATADVIRFTPPEELVAALERVTSN